MVSYHCLDTAFFCIISFFCILTDEGLRSETCESNSVRNVLLRQCSKNSLSITNAVMSLYDIINPLTKVTKVTPRVDLLPILKYKTNNKQSDPPPPKYSSDNHYGGWIIVCECLKMSSSPWDTTSELLKVEGEGGFMGGVH